MISFSQNFLNEWDKKIIYAPNGFGKTTNSKKLNNYLNEQNSRSLLFTRREIEKLVANYGHSIYFGETAINAEQNKKIETLYHESSKIKQFFKTKYNTNSITKLKKNSFYIQYQKISKLDEFSDIININFDGINDLQVEKAVEFDKILNFDIYKKAIKIINDKNNIKKEKILKNQIRIDCDTFEKIEALEKYAENTNFQNCPLCGKRFSSKEKLIEAINSKKAKYKVLDDSNLYDALCSISLSIYENYYNNNDIHDILYNFDEQTLTCVKGMVQLLSNYVNLCEKCVVAISHDFGNISLENGNTLKKVQNDYVNNNIKINKEKGNITNINSFTNFIIKELNLIISTDEEVEFNTQKGKLEVSVFVKGKEIKNLYEILSESEIKRFTLVVLRALIKYGKYEALILDDPIDSYDDYYMLVACEYIKSIVSEKRLLHRYILTNNFTALSHLSSILKCDSKIYYYSPDCIFSNCSPQVFDFVCHYNEIDIASKNELKLLKDFLDGNLRADNDLAYISFIVTLRNLKTLVINNYNKLLIKKAKVNGTTNRYDADTLFTTDLKTIVEHYFMHFDEKNDANYGFNSNNIEVNRVHNLYERVCSLKESVFSAYKSDNSSLCSLREKVAKRKFSTYTGSTILNLILSKICIVSYLKYEFEKLLIVKLKSNYCYSANDIDSICHTNALGKKLNMAKKINRGNSHNASTFLNDYSKVFESNKLLFNLFDHALEQMFPPYIAVNVKDIKRFRLEISRLDSTY